MKKNYVIKKLKVVSLRSEVEREMSEKNERIKKEKDEIEAKLFAKKKEVRESEQNYLKQISILEKEKAILNEKLSSSEIKKKELIENYEKEIDNLNNTYRSMKDEKLKDSDYSGMQIDELRKRCSFLEITVSEKQSLYEKDKLLWEGRFKFLESQKDQSKKEQSENSKKFETLLENLQKKSSQEKEKIETNYQSQLSNMEQKFQNQIKELNENYTKINTELITSNKELEREIKSLNIEMDLRGKNLNSNDYDKKVTEMLNIQDKMKKEIDVLRREKEEKINEIITQYDKEKDILKNKNYEIENKQRELESKRGQLLLESEKEKAKYSLERDHYESKVKDLQESLEKQDKKIETLLRDNEKLKNEKNAIKRPGSQSTIGRGVNLTQNTSIIGQTPSNYNISDKPLIPSSTYNKDPITFTSNYSNLVNNMGSKLPITNNSPFRKNFNLDNSVNLNDNSTNNDLNNSINSNVSFNKPHKYSLKPTTKYDDDKTKKYEDEKKK